ncbi:MAG: glycosyltransferase [Alphaproteobacteria bacterium]|nr:glycosyltransferase [Alphaproteobacteria bacterium]
MPRVSVLTPLYNTNPVHLREMIESILNQTFTDFEFLILNDSPDNTEIEDIVKSYKDKRIKYSKNERNMGITPSRNKLLKMARGEYIAIFDHDDISVPTRLAQEVEFLDTHPHIGVVSGWLEYFGLGNNNILRTPEYDSAIRAHLTENCYVAHTAAMIRKSVLTANNIEYEEFYTPAEDYRLWARLMDVTHFHNLQTVLVRYRWFENNTSKRMNDMREEAAANIRWELSSKYPEYRLIASKLIVPGTRFRLRLFGFIPLLKIKNNWVLLFECIPLFKIKWK